MIEPQAIDHFAIIEAEQRVRPLIIETDLIASRRPSNGRLLMKCEHQQRSGSFKLRGAANKILSLRPAEIETGVVTASNGNHALAVAQVAAQLGVKAEVFVSKSISSERRARLAKFDIEVSFVAGDCLDAETAARHAADVSGRTYISPYNDPLIVAGQGTLALELVRQHPALDAVFVSVGGGGLVSGIGTYLKAMSPSTRVVACWPENSRALYESIEAGEIVESEELPTMSTSTAGGIEPGSITFEIARQVIDDRVLVSEREILSALQSAWRHDDLILEGAAGVALAGYEKLAADFEGSTVAVVLCGGNLDQALAWQIKA